MSFLNPQNVTIFGNRVVVVIISYIGVTVELGRPLTQHDWCLHEKRRQREPCEAEMGVILTGSKRAGTTGINFQKAREDSSFARSMAWLFLGS